MSSIVIAGASSGSATLVPTDATTTTITLPNTTGTLALASSVKGLGLSGETWHDVSGTKTSGTTYTAPAYPIMVSVGTIQTNPYHGVLATVAGVTVLNTFAGSNNYTSTQNGSFIVPAGASYVVTITGTLGFWAELY